MIYVCTVARSGASSIGLLLWKVRQVFSTFPREYQLLVVDDASTDGTAEVLERYQRALPMTVLTNAAPSGAAAAAEALLREALQRTDRPRRDAAVLLPPDFSVSPEALPELVRQLESGADLVVGERPLPHAFGHRALYRMSPWLLRPGIRVGGVRDFGSGCAAVRLATVKAALKEREGRLLESDGYAAHAELIARTARVARRVSVTPLPPPMVAETRQEHVWALALDLFRAGRRIRVPPPPTRPTRTPAEPPEAAPAEVGGLS